jgi:tetratricopeptide (TPR) repeat protein
MKQFTRSIVCLALFFIGQTAISQTVFRGVVLDSANNVPVPNAKVGITGQGVGETTNDQGNFTYRKYHKVLDNNSTLIVSAQGYTTLTNDAQDIRALMNNRGVIYIEKSEILANDFEESINSVQVFWDASKANGYRDVTKELNFLVDYILDNEIQDVSFIVFNNKIRISEELKVTTAIGKDLRALLTTISYKGVSDYDLISVKDVHAVFLIAANKPAFGTFDLNQNKPVHVIRTNQNPEDLEYFKKLCGYTSGNYYAPQNNRFEEDILINETAISGIIFASGSPIENASLMKLGSLKEYITDTEGAFLIPAKSGDVITIKYLGMYAKTLVITNEKHYEIELQNKTEILDEVLLKEEIRKPVTYDYFDPIKSVEYINGKKYPVSFVNKKDDFYKGARNVFQLIGGRIGPIRIGVQYGRLKFMHLKQPLRCFVDGVERDVDNLDPATIIRSSVYLSPDHSRSQIIFTTRNNPDIQKQMLALNGISAKNNSYNEVLQTLTFDKIEADYLSEISVAKSTKIKLENYRKLKNSYLNKVEFYVDMALYFQRIDVSAATEVRNDFALLAKNNVKALRVLAYLYESANANVQAQKIYERIVAMDPGNPQSYRDLALVFQENGEYNKALELYINMLGDKILGVDFSQLYPAISNELQRLVGLHKNKIDYQRLPNDWLAVGFNVDVRMTLAWSDANAPFEFQFVNPENKFYNWNSKGAEGDYKIPVEEFIVDDAPSGKWLVNIRYTGFEDEISIPPYLKYTVYKNYGTVKEKKQIKLVRLDKQIDKVTLDSFVY